MFIFFKTYPNSIGATLVSIFGSVFLSYGVIGLFVEPASGASCLLVGGVLMFWGKKISEHKAKKQQLQADEKQGIINGQAVQVNNAPAYTQAIPAAPYSAPAASQTAPYIYPASTISSGAAKTPDPALTPDAYFSTGMDLQRKNQHLPATVAFRKGLASASSRDDIWNALGISYRALGQYQDAINAYNTAISLNPGRGLYKCNLGIAYLSMGDAVSSIPYFQQGLPGMQTENAPEFPTSLANYGLALGKCGMINDALSCIQEAERLGYPNGDAIRKMIQQ